MMNIFHKLNGWQRLWVLASIVWLLLVGYYAFANYPGARSSYEYIGSASCIFSELYGKDAKRAIEVVLPELASFEEGAPRTCKALFERIDKSGQAGKVQKVYEQFLRESRIAFFARVVAYWTIPTLVAYLLGIGVAWIVRGFRRPT